MDRPKYTHFFLGKHFDLTWPCVFQPVFGHMDAGCCPIAASSTRAVIRSRPPPPGSAAHRRLEAERRYSSSPRQRRSGTPGTRARARFPHILTRFPRPRPLRPLKDLAGGKSLRGGGTKGKERRRVRGALVQPSSISVSSLTLPIRPLQHPQRLEKQTKKSRLLSARGEFAPRS